MVVHTRWKQEDQKFRAILCLLESHQVLSKEEDGGRSGLHCYTPRCSCFISFWPLDGPEDFITLMLQMKDLSLDQFG